jgi:hypothetical protein
MWRWYFTCEDDILYVKMIFYMWRWYFVCDRWYFICEDDILYVKMICYMWRWYFICDRWYFICEDDILLTCEKYLHGYIISLRGEACAHKKYFNSATFYWRACTNHEKWEVMYMHVRGIDASSVSTVCLYDFGNVRIVWYSLFVFFITFYDNHCWLSHWCIIC